jgi:tetratricopeptide (TPR) repeat protein
LIPLRSSEPRRAVLGLLLAACVTVSAPALAQDRAAARLLFVRGERAFAEARWDAALEAYTSAYEAAPLPGFLFNIGQCHRKLEHWEVAADFFRRYLEAVPDAPNRDDAEDLLREVEQRAAGVSDHAAAAVPAAPPAGRSPAVSPPATEVRPTTSGRALGLPTWISLGAGVALSGVAVLFALDLAAAQSSFDDPSLDCARRPDRCRALQGRGETAATARTVFLATGLAALAAGGVLLILDLRAPAADREPALALSLGAGRLDAVMTW